MKLKKLISVLLSSILTIFCITSDIPQTAYAEETESAVWNNENGKYTFTNNTENELYDSDIPYLEFDISDIDMSGVMTVYADITVSSGTSYVTLGYYTSEGSYHYGEGFGFSSQPMLTYLDFEHTDVTRVVLVVWNLPANSVITVENVEFSEIDPHTTDVVGRWTTLSDGTYYYNHGDNPDANIGETHHFSLKMPDGVRMSDVQAVTFKTRTENYDVGVNICGFDENGNWYEKSTGSPTSDEMKTVTIKLRGNISSMMRIRLNWIRTGTRVYISDIQYITGELPEVPIEPNDILIDESEAVIYDANNTIFIGPDALTSAIKTSGTIKIYTELENVTSSSWHSHAIGWQDYSENSWDYYINWEQADDDKIIELRVEKDDVDELHDRAVFLQGHNYKYIKAVFAPDSDSKPPATEEIIPDETEKGELDKEFYSNKNSIKQEKEGPRKSSDMEHGKLYIQKGDLKDYKGGKAYAMRFVQKMKLNDLKDIKNTTMIIKVDGKYIELTTDCYYKNVSIDGRELICEDDEVFIIFIIDNIDENKEIEFSQFRFNK